MAAGFTRPNRAAVTAFAFFVAAASVFLTLAGCGDSASPVERGAATVEESDRARVFLAGRTAPVFSYEVVATFPHDNGDFTQGLDLDGGVLFEGTGRRGASRLIKTDLRTGETVGELELAPEYFGEGVTVLGDEVFQLTYTSGTGFVYDRDGLELKRTFSYGTQGWGLTHDGRSLIMSDGTATLYFLDPANGAETGRLSVSDNLGPLPELNELEYAAGVIYANIWHVPVIAAISPASGEVEGWIDLSGLNPDPSSLTGEYVLNGIAWAEETGHLLVTGKCWPHIYEIRLSTLSL